LRLRTRIFLVFFAAAALGIYYVADWVRAEVRPHYLKSMEESLVDTSTVLAAVVERDVREGKLDVSELRAAFRTAQQRKFSVRVYDMLKTRVDLRVYVTDGKGTVVFDSDGGRDEGEDYSQWNDVYLTLKGKYGVRATWRDPRDPASNVLYVAAPIRDGEKIVGALTVSKPLDSVNIFIAGAKRKIVIGALAALAVGLLLSWLLSGWVTRPLRRLTAYAQAVRDGQRAAPPKLGGGEMGTMAAALEEMREALEGKKYVENYVGTLTHEIKGPLSAIRGAAELLAEELSPERRARFAANVRGETGRIGQVIDRLLELASLESRRELRDAEDVDLAALAAEVAASLAAALEAAGVSLRNEAQGPAPVRGERFLLRGALANLLRNAVEFSPRGGEILITLEEAGDGFELAVADGGPGVPDYALGRVFEKFYSLARPATGRKSSGLGLSFVREVALLHGGEASLENRPEGGALARLGLPRTPPAG